MGSSPKVIQHALITFARSWSALAAARSLGKRGVRIYTGDTVRLGAATFSKYINESFVYPDPSNERKFMQFLVDKCHQIHEKYGGEILLLPIHEETYVISKHIDKLPKYVYAVLTEHALLQEIQHKGELITWAQKHGVRMPTSWYFKEPKKVLSLVKKVTFPIFVKLPESSGSTGIYRVESKEEFIKTINEISEPVVIQSFVKGKDYCCCALFDHGKPIAMITYTALQTYPLRGGTTIYRKTVMNSRIEREAQKLLAGLKWHGVAELDFRIDEKTGEALLIEVNPRFWGGLNHAIKANLDFPYLVWRMAEGHKLNRITKIRKNIRTGNFIGALGATIEEIAEVDRFIPTLKEIIRKPTISNAKKLVKASLDIIPIYRRHLVRRYLKRKAVDDIYDPDDPTALAGLLFPLAVYAKHGKINEKLLISSSAERVKKD